MINICTVQVCIYFSLSGQKFKQRLSRKKLLHYVMLRNKILLGNLVYSQCAGRQQLPSHLERVDHFSYTKCIILNDFKSAAVGKKKSPIKKMPKMALLIPNRILPPSYSLCSLFFSWKQNGHRLWRCRLLWCITVKSYWGESLIPFTISHPPPYRYIQYVQYMWNIYTYVVAYPQ